MREVAGERSRRMLDAVTAATQLSFVIGAAAALTCPTMLWPVCLPEQGCFELSERLSGCARKSTFRSAVA